MSKVNERLSLIEAKLHAFETLIEGLIILHPDTPEATEIMSRKLSELRANAALKKAKHPDDTDMTLPMEAIDQEVQYWLHRLEMLKPFE